MNWKIILPLLAILAFGGAGAYYILERGHDHAAGSDHGHAHGAGGHDDHAAEPPRGPHRGRMFTDGAFAVELAIFEDGVPPEFRAWFTLDGKPLAPDAVQLTVKLTRPGNVVDEHSFAAAGDFVRSPAEVYEPHSFHYAIVARRGDRIHRWELDAPEMQTIIAADAAERAGVVAEAAGPAVIAETLVVYGQARLNADRVARATPRFAGLVREMRKSLGDTVAAGEVVATVETNDTLALIEIATPRAGVVVERHATAGQTVAEGAALYTTADLTEVWIDLAVPAGAQVRVEVGQSVALQSDGGLAAQGRIAWLSPFGAAGSQSVTARVVLPNPDGRWRPGLFVRGEITLATHEVPVAVREAALQTLFDFDVVFSRHGDLYQARPLELGRRGGGFVEILKGLKPGELYVTGNSFLIKADIGKSGASHDH